MFDYRHITDECIKCGKCIPVCTIHQVSPDETTSPRGFLELLGSYQKGELALDENAKAIFESCFLCTNCVDVCPNKLETDMVIEQVRAEIAQEFGIAWFKRLFFTLLRHRSVMDLLARFGYVAKSCFFAEEPNKGMRPRFSMPIIKAGRILPSVAKKSFLSSYPEEIPAAKERKVAIFIGCMANYAYTSVGDSLVEVLSKLGLSIMIPKKQLCCGAPAYFTGDFATVDYLIKHNITYFESFIGEVEAILIPEATCSSMMINDWEKFLHDQPEWRERAKKITQKCYIATKWLFSNTDLAQQLAAKGGMGHSLTYHDPCHARKTQGVWKEPRALLSQNYTIKEMRDPNRCCGFGGVTIQTEKFHLAQAAGVPKAKMIEETGADYVVAECSACRMQLSNALYQNCVPKTLFKNPIELIAEALRR
ncbi:MAG: (Fe-S)-binding protein [Campylobacterales bacterium]